MIENVATIVAPRRSQHDVMRLQSRLSTLNREVATGSKADISGELGSRTPLLIGLRDAHARTERYLQSNATLTLRLDAMQVALGAMQDAAGQLGWEALAAIGRSDYTSLRNVQVSAAALETVVRHLNTSVSGRYLFSGNLVETRPMVAGTRLPPSSDRSSRMPQPPRAARSTSPMLRGSWRISMPSSATRTAILPGISRLRSIRDRLRASRISRVSSTRTRGSPTA